MDRCGFRASIEQKHLLARNFKNLVDRLGKSDIICHRKIELPYQERRRERPDEARQPAEEGKLCKVLNPAAVDRKMRVRRIQTLRRGGAFFSPQHQRKELYYGKKTVYIGIRHRGASR